LLEWLPPLERNPKFRVVYESKVGRHFTRIIGIDVQDVLLYTVSFIRLSERPIELLEQMVSDTAIGGITNEEELFITEALFHLAEIDLGILAVERRPVFFVPQTGRLVCTRPTWH